MQDLFSIDPKKLRQTIRLLSIELQSRGWKAETLHARSPIISITRDDAKQILVYGSTPPTTSFVAASVADNKYATYELLKSLPAVRQLDTVRLIADASSEQVEAFLGAHGRIVVKPIDGAHGRGITTNVHDVKTAEYAIQAARDAANGSSILLQAQYGTSQSHELRVLCIDGHYIGAIYRQPARVLGDGIQTIRQLIEQENQQENRGEPYVQLLAKIDIPRAENYLGDAIHNTPAKGEWVNVLGVANYGSGGETIDATDQVPGWLIEDAIAISKHLDLPLVGIDFIMKQYPSRDASRDDLDAVLLEVNRSPSLGIHDEPTGGSRRYAVRALVDYLARI